MASTILDYVTIGTICLLTVAFLLAIYMLITWHRYDFFYANSKVFLQVFIVFLLALFTNSLYISIPNTRSVGMIPPIVFEIPSPDIILTYPSSARVGETVEIVLEITNFVFPTDIALSLENHETGEIIDEAFITLEPRSIERHSFKNRISEENYAVDLVVKHPEPITDIPMEYRITVTVKKSGMEAAALLLMGVVVAVSILTLTIVWKRKNLNQYLTPPRSRRHRENIRDYFFINLILTK